MKAKFDKAMNALLLEVDESIVENIRKIGHEYAAEAEKRGIERGKVIGEHGCERPTNSFIPWIE